MAHPKRTVVCFAGDGCFMMTSQEMATAVAHDLPIIVIVVNNSMAPKPPPSVPNPSAGGMGWMAWSATLLAGLLVVPVALRAIAPWDHQHPILGPIFTRPESSDDGNTNDTKSAKPPAA